MLGSGVDITELKKFSKEVSKFEQLAGERELFICGHSLGGALALIHSVKLKNVNPVLHTYGMPRTFTRDAVMQLSEITHYRHVNDNDPIPAVPAEANLITSYINYGDGLVERWAFSGHWVNFSLTRWLPGETASGTTAIRLPFSQPHRAGNGMSVRGLSQLLQGVLPSEIHFH
jgi:hypothetical protein